MHLALTCHQSSIFASSFLLTLASFLTTCHLCHLVTLSPIIYLFLMSMTALIYYHSKKSQHKENNSMQNSIQNFRKSMVHKSTHSVSCQPATLLKEDIWMCQPFKPPVWGLAYTYKKGRHQSITGQEGAGFTKNCAICIWPLC